MSNPESKHQNSPNLPAGEHLLPEELRAAPPSELADALERMLDSMTEETYDGALIDAYLDALDEKAPMPALPDVETAYADFQQKRRELSPEYEEGTIAVSRSRRPIRLRRIMRVALVAALTVVCLLSSMVVAQASGVDVFGAMAQWTSDVFSLGPVRSDGGRVTQTKQDLEIGRGWDEVKSGESEFSSIQEALDYYGVTEVAAPLWIPEDYVLETLDVVSMNDPPYLNVYAQYDGDVEFPVDIDIQYYWDIPNLQIQKTDAPPEIFYRDGTTLYLIENNRNYAVAWATEHYECCITGPLAQKDDLLQIAYSMIDSI